jgi:hypothetical protein
MATTQPPECAQQVPPPPCVFGGGESLQSLSQDIFSLSQRLTLESVPNLAVIEAFRSAKYSLTMAIASMEGRNALPEKDVIASNQKSWPETANRMGARKNPRPQCLPRERGLMEHSIGAIKGKRKRLHNDPYARGERSGKCAKRDALFQAANAQARATAFPDALFPDVPSPDARAPP